MIGRVRRILVPPGSIRHKAAHKMRDSLFPQGTKRRQAVKAFAKQIGLIGFIANGYHAWFTQYERNHYRNSSTVNGPLISVVVPCYNTRPREFLAMAYSVVNQFYDDWELILVNASSSKKSQELIRSAEAIDSRIRVVELPENKGISGNTNAGIAAAKGEYIALLDHDDLLVPFALSKVAETIKKNPDAGLMYSDEDKISEDGSTYFNPHYKFGFSPELLTNVNYITHLAVIKRAVVDKVGGFDPACDGAQDYDFFLRVVDTGTQVVHIPDVLYHWRATRGSTANAIESKGYVMNAGVLAVKNHLKRTGQNAKVCSIKNRPNFVRVTYEKMPSTDIVFVPAKNTLQQALYLCDLNNRFKIEDTKIFCPSNIPMHETLQKIHKNIVFVDPGKDFLEQVCKQSNAAVLMVVNGYVSFKKPHWLKSIASVAAKDGVLSCSPLITDKKKEIKDAGYFWQQNLLMPFLRGHHITEDTVFGYAGWTRNVAAPSMRLFAIKRQTLLEVVAKNVRITDPTQHANYCQKQGLRTVVWSHTRGYLMGDNPVRSVGMGNSNTVVSRLALETAMLPDFWEYDHE